jgi:hypothetical protein
VLIAEECHETGEEEWLEGLGGHHKGDQLELGTGLVFLLSDIAQDSKYVIDGVIC